MTEHRFVNVSRPCESSPTLTPARWLWINFLIMAPAVSPMLSRRTCNMETILSPDKNTRIKVELGDLAASPSYCHRAKILWHDPSVVFLMSISKEISPIWREVRSWWHCLLCYTSLISTGNTRSSKVNLKISSFISTFEESKTISWANSASMIHCSLLLGRHPIGSALRCLTNSLTPCLSVTDKRNEVKEDAHHKAFTQRSINVSIAVSGKQQDCMDKIMGEWVKKYMRNKHART